MCSYSGFTPALNVSCSGCAAGLEVLLLCALDVLLAFLLLQWLCSCTIWSSELVVLLCRFATAHNFLLRPPWMVLDGFCVCISKIHVFAAKQKYAFAKYFYSLNVGGFPKRSSLERILLVIDYVTWCDLKQSTQNYVRILNKPGWKQRKGICRKLKRR